MAFEMRKSIYRRLRDPLFHQRIFKGDILDVGAGEDGFAKYAYMFPGVTHVREWQHSDGDGMTLPGLGGGYNCVVSSHCLEHLADPYIALTRWIEVLAPGGYIVATVPDFEMYEHHQWPSQNNEHTHAFSTYMDNNAWLVSVVKLAGWFAGVAMTLKIERLESTFDWGEDPNLDQTCWGSGAAEACIELVMRKL